MSGILWFLIFPGLVFTAVVGMLATWVDRKVTARIQYRVGPPWYQPFADFAKLLGKETILPRGASRTMFLAAPLIGLAGVTLVSAILWVGNLWETGFVGDVIVVLYLLALPPLAVIIGGAASGNPLASVGASREMKLLLGYELPFILAVIVAIMKSGGGIRIADIVQAQVAGGPFLLSVSGFIAFVVGIICMQAKLAVVPFDVAEAETEIMGGALIEYAGPPLGMFKLTKAMMYLVAPIFVITMFWGGFVVDASSVGSAIAGVILNVLKYVVLLVIVIVLKNTNPRVRVEHAVKFFWGPVTFLALVAIVLSIVGGSLDISWL